MIRNPCPIFPAYKGEIHENGESLVSVTYRFQIPSQNRGSNPCWGAKPSTCQIPTPIILTAAPAVTVARIRHIPPVFARRAISPVGTGTALLTAPSNVQSQGFRTSNSGWPRTMMGADKRRQTSFQAAACRFLGCSPLEASFSSARPNLANLINIEQTPKVHLDMMKPCKINQVELSGLED